MMDKPGKILIVKLGSIGDVVNTLPLVNALREGLPEAEIVWLIEPKSFPIVEGQRSVDRFIIHRRGDGWPAARETLREIREFGPDLVIDLQRILRSSFFTYFSGCRERLGFDRRRSKEFSWLLTNRKISPADPRRHMVKQYLEFAQYLGISLPRPPRFDLPVVNGDCDTARRLIPDKLLESGFIACNIGAAKPANRWPVFRWIELIDLILSRRGEGVVLTGGAQDRERGRQIREQVSSRQGLSDCTGRTTLKQLGGLFSLARAVVSGDTGPMHIASALGVRTVGIFGPADPRRTGPFHHLDLVIRSPAECAPCGRRRCRRSRCLEEIPADWVLQKVFPGSGLNAFRNQGPERL